jgi:hypothetical protein
MKSLIQKAIALSIVMLSMTQPALAVNLGAVVNHALYTDIVATIDGHPLRSYNVNGHTAIVAEDLRGYGFQVDWNAKARSLSVERTINADGTLFLPESWPSYTPEPAKGTIGSWCKNILRSDIVTYLSGSQVDGFNIDGETLIWLSDLSPYGTVTWDAANNNANLTLDKQPALTQWSAKLETSDQIVLGQTLELTVTATDGQAELAVQSSPDSELQVSLNQNRLTISHSITTEERPSYQETEYASAYNALIALKLPNVTDDNFSSINSAELRAAVAPYFQVMLNGQPLSGDLWRSQGGNHSDFNFDFGQPVTLHEGDVLRLWVGMV